MRSILGRTLEKTLGAHPQNIGPGSTREDKGCSVLRGSYGGSSPWPHFAITWRAESKDNAVMHVS